MEDKSKKNVKVMIISICILFLLLCVKSLFLDGTTIKDNRILDAYNEEFNSGFVISYKIVAVKTVDVEQREDESELANLEGVTTKEAYRVMVRRYLFKILPIKDFVFYIEKV